MRQIKHYLLGVIAALAMGFAANADPTIERMIETGPWRIVPAKTDNDTVGLFFARRVDPETGSHAAFYFEKDGETWVPHVYSGNDIAAAAIKAELTFAGEGSLRHDTWVFGEILRSEWSSTNLPPIEYDESTNQEIAALTAVGVFEDDDSFPNSFTSATGGLPFGTFDRAELTCDISTDSYNVIGGYLEHTAESFTISETTNGIGDCFWWGTVCGAWGPWTTPGWTAHGCTPTMAGGAVCKYKKVCTRTRTCTSGGQVCCIPWSNTWTDTQTTSVISTCLVDDGNGCAGCSPACLPPATCP